MQKQVVWFKRDLRVFDNEALSKAIASGPVICVYILEREYWDLSPTSNRQWRFIRQSLIDLGNDLGKVGLSLHVVESDVLSVMVRLLSKFGIFHLHSHQETGNLWTYDRDRKLANWCKENKVRWSEYSQSGVVRPVKRRGCSFRQHWERWVSQPIFQLDYTLLNELQAVRNSLDIKIPTSVKCDEMDCPGLQLGGRTEGLKVLDEFLDGRGKHYVSEMSSPLTAEHSCSRLSPYIAYGCLSLREIVIRVKAAHDQSTDKVWRKSLSAFRTRLWWHCYWMQTLENNPNVETSCLIPQMELLDRPFSVEKFEAWKYGKTGWPMVDACMRYLHYHGWINFRMRAMLVSIATCTLSLPWKPVADWLASMFVDFEPGIHYPQVQMHSGTAGGTILRIYNPTLQAATLDPEGVFVRRWVPELEKVSINWLVRPWDMPAELRFKGGYDVAGGYPDPLVNFEFSNRAAKNQLTNIKRNFSILPAPGYNERVARAEEGFESLHSSLGRSNESRQGDLFENRS